MEFAIVCLVRNGVIESSELVIGFTTDEVSKHTDAVFRILCQNLFCPSLSIKLAEEEILDAIENGYFECEDEKTGKAASVQIHWPNVAQKITRPKKITEVSCIDPESKGEVYIEIWKDPTSEGMFGVDTSFLESVRDVGIPSPFNPNEYFDMRDESDYTEPPIMEN